MLLKELKEGQRFEFTDKNSGLVLTDGGAGYSAHGGFTYVKAVSGGCPLLLPDSSGQGVIAVPNTYQRDVLIIL